MTSNTNNMQQTLFKKSSSLFSRFWSLISVPSENEIVSKIFLRWLTEVLNARRLELGEESYHQGLSVDVLINTFAVLYGNYINKYNIEPSVHRIQQIILSNKDAKDFLVDQGLLEEYWHSSQMVI